MAWMLYGNGTTRVDPGTGEVQLAGSMDPKGQPGDWNTIGNVNKPIEGQEKYYSMMPSAEQMLMFRNIAGAASSGQAGASGGTGGAGSTSGAGGTGGGGGGTYYGGTGGGTMADGSSGSYWGVNPQIGQGQISNLILPGGGQLSPQQTNQIMGLYSSYEGGNAQAGQTLVSWLKGMGMSSDQLNTAVSNLRNQTGPNAAAQVGGAGQQQPESVALQQMAQIDPATEALRQGLASSYASTLQQGPTPPAAGDVQSYLNLYGQVDPGGLAARQQLQGALAQQSALGTQLDPETVRELEQQTRESQIARGNVYGTPQLVQEAMTRGQAGLALQQQRQQNLQSFLSSGQDVGSTALGLYQQGLGNYRQGQQAALSYLGSGQTPYQAGAGYLNTAENRAASAAQGGPNYMPQGPSSYYTGAGTSSFPQYGLDMSQLSNQWYNSINQWNMQSAALGMGGKSGGQRAGAAGAGALSGAASGALAGSAIPGIGTAIGAGVGALAGGLGGYFSG